MNKSLLVPLAVAWLCNGCLTGTEHVLGDANGLGGCGGVELRHYNSDEQNQLGDSSNANVAEAGFLDSSPRVIYTQRLEGLQADELLAITGDFAATLRYDLPNAPQLAGVGTAIVLTTSPTATTGVVIAGPEPKTLTANLHHGRITKGAAYVVQHGDADGAPRYLSIVGYAMCADASGNGVKCSAAEGGADWYVRVDSLGTWDVRRFSGLTGGNGNVTAGWAISPASSSIQLAIQPMSACDSSSPPYTVVASASLGTVSAGEVIEAMEEIGLQLFSTHRARALGKIIVASSPTSTQGFDVTAETFDNLPVTLPTSHAMPLGYGTFFKAGSRSAPYAVSGAYLNAVVIACEDSPEGHVEASGAYVHGLFGTAAAIPPSVAPTGPIGTNAYTGGAGVLAPPSNWATTGTAGMASIIPVTDNGKSGFAVGLWANALTYTTLTTTGPSTVVGVRVAAQYCTNNLATYGYSWDSDPEGSPAFNLWIDGAYVGSRLVTEQNVIATTSSNGVSYATTGFAGYLFPVSLPAGTHTVAVQYFNDYKGSASGTSCDRNLLVDGVGFASFAQPDATVIDVAQVETTARVHTTIPVLTTWQPEIVYSVDLGPLTSANIGEVIQVAAEYQINCANIRGDFSYWSGQDIPEVAEYIQLGSSATSWQDNDPSLDGILGDNLDLVSWEQERTRVASRTITADDVAHGRRYVKLTAYSQTDGTPAGNYINIGGGKLSVVRYPKAGASAAP